MHPDNTEFMSGEVRAGRMDYVADDEPKSEALEGSEAISRADICQMSRGALADELRARGLNPRGATDNLRVRLAEAIFPHDF